MAYNRELAVRYALKYGLNPNTDYKYFKSYGNLGDDCTNFVSQCIHSGGCEMVDGDHATWWYRDKENWSISWVNSHSLYWCLLIRYQHHDNGPRAKEVFDVYELTVGDVIIYEGLDGQIDHSGIITGYRDGLPTITQHSPELVDISYFKTNKGKMHFMKITG